MSHERSHDMVEALRAVHRARSALESARAARQLPGVAASEQRELLTALEAYAATLTRHGHPMPYRMHSELDVYRALLDPKRGRAERS